MDDAQAKGWDAAQSLVISLDLIAAAKQELEMLAEVDRHPCLYGGPVVSRAIERYERCLLPLLAKEGGASREPILPIIPPLDCAWVWHVHRLNPTRYAKDCEDIFGRILDAPVVNPEDKDAAIKATMDLWTRLYADEPYDIDFIQIENENANSTQMEEVNTTIIESGAPALPKLAYNLADAVARQKSFFYQVSQPFVMHESFLRSAEQRYKGFLYLFSLNKGLFLVPTYDVDIMWHAHQLSPAAYTRDCLAILKRVLDHDDTDSDRSAGKKLNTGFKDTCNLWEQTFGSIYVKAGAMFRGDQPSPVPLVVLNADYLVEKTSGHVEQQDQETYLRQRQTVQVCLALLGARDVPINHAGPTLFIRVKVLRRCKSFKLDTYEVPTYSDPVWRQLFMLKFETSTEGVVLQLRSSTTGIFSPGSKLLGEVKLMWVELLASPSLSIREWLPLTRRKFSPLSAGLLSTALNVSASITPPIAAPYLLRTLEVLSSVNPKDGAYYVDRTAFDHGDKETLVVHIQYGKKNMPEDALSHQIKEVSVHQGPRKGFRLSQNKENSGQIVARAQPFLGPDLATSRQWVLSDGDLHLSIQKDAEDSLWHLRPELTLEGKVGYPVRLVSGRRLDYQVNGATAEEEAGFVTLVRYFPEAPLGKATALFNTSSGAMEIMPEEDVPLVVLLSTVISLSVGEMLGRHPRLHKLGNSNVQGRPRGNDWGAIIIERQANEKSDIARKMALYNLLNYHYWWDMPFVIWCASFYSNSTLLSDEKAYQYGGLIGDGRGAQYRSSIK